MDVFLWSICVQVLFPWTEVNTLNTRFFGGHSNHYTTLTCHLPYSKLVNTHLFTVLWREFIRTKRKQCRPFSKKILPSTCFQFLAYIWVLSTVMRNSNFIPHRLGSRLQAVCRKSAGAWNSWHSSLPMLLTGFSYYNWTGFSSIHFKRLMFLVKISKNNSGSSRDICFSIQKISLFPKIKGFSLSIVSKHTTGEFWFLVLDHPIKFQPKQTSLPQSNTVIKPPNTWTSDNWNQFLFPMKLEKSWRDCRCNP